jgi:uncharacterized protein (DUF427 family)
VSANVQGLRHGQDRDVRPYGRVRTAPSHKRVRVVFGGELIVDTDDALYVWEGPGTPSTICHSPTWPGACSIPSRR